MRYEVTHTTRYNYEVPVSQCLNEVRVTPRAYALQHVLETGLQVDPAPAFLYHRKDYFGNDVSTFAVFDNHEKLTAAAKSVVEVESPNLGEGLPEVKWGDVRGSLAACPDQECLQASEFVHESP